MFTALKKLVGNSDSKNQEDSANGGQGGGSSSKSNPRPGVQTMGLSLQRKFARGVQYNMKIILKGDRNVGKTCLFLRLQGQKFKEEYIPTEEIQVASIHWNYKATDDVVKVEVWDVVDKGKKRKKIDGLKLDNAIKEALDEEPALDAEFINVYKGTHGVIMILDITKQWTFDYVQRELPKVPPEIPVLVLSNHRDMGHHRCVTEEQVTFFIENLDRPTGAAQIRCAESSMRNGFGLKFLHKFFNLPFLQLQRETLLKQLEINTQEINATNEELNVLMEMDDQKYDTFIDNLSNKRRQVAEFHSPSPTGIAPISESASNSSHQNLTAGGLKKSAGMSTSKSAPIMLLNHNQEYSQPSSMKEIQKSYTSSESNHMVEKSKSTKNTDSLPLATANSDLTNTSSTAAPNLKSNSTKIGNAGGSFMSRIFSRNNTNESVASEVSVNGPEIIQQASSPKRGSPSKVTDVEEFVPDDAHDSNFDSFLNDTVEASAATKNSSETLSDEDDDDVPDLGGKINPLVTGFQDDLDPEDFFKGHSEFGRLSGPGGSSAMVLPIMEDSEEDEFEENYKYDFSQDGNLKKENPQLEDLSPKKEYIKTSDFEEIHTVDLQFEGATATNSDEVDETVPSEGIISPSSDSGCSSANQQINSVESTFISLDNEDFSFLESAYSSKDSKNSKLNKDSSILSSSSPTHSSSCSPFSEEISSQMIENTKSTKSSGNSSRKKKLKDEEKSKSRRSKHSDEDSKADSSSKRSEKSKHSSKKTKKASSNKKAVSTLDEGFDTSKALHAENERLEAFLASVEDDNSENSVNKSSF